LPPHIRRDVHALELSHPRPEFAHESGFTDGTKRAASNWAPVPAGNHEDTVARSDLVLVQPEVVGARLRVKR